MASERLSEETMRLSGCVEGRAVWEARERTRGPSCSLPFRFSPECLSVKIKYVANKLHTTALIGGKECIYKTLNKNQSV